MKLRTLYCLVALAGLSPVFATTYAELSLDEIIGKAEVAFYGRVAAIEVRNISGEPWTVVEFAVAAVLKGEEIIEQGKSGSHKLSFFGGRLPSGRTVSVSGMPHFSLGQEVIVFAYDAEYYSPVVGFSQGLWQLGDSGFMDAERRLLGVDALGLLTLRPPVLGEAPASAEELVEALENALEALE